MSGLSLGKVATRASSCAVARNIFTFGSARSVSQRRWVQWPPRPIDREEDDVVDEANDCCSTAMASHRAKPWPLVLPAAPEARFCLVSVPNFMKALEVVVCLALR